MARISRAEAVGEPTTIRVSPVELARFERAAELAGQPKSQFFRQAMLAKADHVLTGVPFREALLLIRQADEAAESLRRQAWRPGYVRRQERLKAARVETVDRNIVLALHSGICGICGERVDPERFHVDHVVPLAKGGAHSYANTQPAHPRCNMKKGDKAPMVH